jgi:hypothetical protein
MLSHVINGADAKHRTLRGLRSSLLGLGTIEESVDPKGFSAFRSRFCGGYRDSHSLVGLALSSEAEHRASGIVGESDKPELIATTKPSPGWRDAGKCKTTAAPVRSATVASDPEIARRGVAKLAPSGRTAGGSILVRTGNREGTSAKARCVLNRLG